MRRRAACAADQLESPEQALEQLYARPGFLIRRANQIAVWLFLDEAAPLGITTTQYGALVIIAASTDMDQIGLARLLRMDKSTTALVVGKLEAAGLLLRHPDPADARRKLLHVTPAGRRILRDIAAPAERARRRLLAAMNARDASRFLAFMERFVEAHESRTGTPPPGTGASQPGAPRA